jgi:hypothetical protein
MGLGLAGSKEKQRHGKESNGLGVSDSWGVFDRAPANKSFIQLHISLIRSRGSFNFLLTPFLKC